MSLNPMTSLPAAAAMRLLGAALFVLLAGCAAEQSDGETPTAQVQAVPGSAQQVEARIGDASVTAVALQTSQIPAAVAAEHGIEQRDDLLMLRVSARQGDAGNVSTAPVQVHASVQTLPGAGRTIEMTEHAVNGLVDHVGTFEVTLPATLRFDITVATPQGEREMLEFSRRFEAR